MLLSSSSPSMTHATLANIQLNLYMRPFHKYFLLVILYFVTQRMTPNIDKKDFLNVNIFFSLLSSWNSRRLFMCENFFTPSIIFYCIPDRTMRHMTKIAAQCPASAEQINKLKPSCSSVTVLKNLRIPCLNFFIAIR